MVSNNRTSGFYSAILFVVWPLLALISACRNYRAPWAKNILWAFIAFYGFVFAVGSENDSVDIVRYVEQYQNLHRVELTVASAREYFDQSGEVDVATTIIAVVLSRFTDIQSVLTLVYGIIFGFFFSRNMWFVMGRLEGAIKPVTILLLVCLFMVIPIWNMNGFRFWTAAHMFIYGILSFLFEGKKGGLVVSSLAVLLHYTFLIPVAVLLAYLLLGNRLTIYFAFFLATFFISEIDLDVFNNLVERYAPEIVQERTAGYRGEEYVETFREGTEERDLVWYVVWQGKALQWAVVGFIVMLFIRGKSFFMENERWLSLFCFILLFYGVGNLFSSLPAAGRFVAIAELSAVALVILYMQRHKEDLVMERFVWVVAPALLLYLMVEFRTGLYSMSAAAVLGNPVMALFLTGEHISLNDVMRMIL